MELTTTDGYRELLQQISHTYTEGRVRAVQAVNTHLVETYWRVGQHIVEFEQAGQIRAEYGKALIENLATDLSLRHGKGFSRSNLIRFRQFYLAYPKSATLSHQLTWSHIVELLKLDDPLERGFYEQQAIRERWSVRELVRQRDSSLFLRLAARKDKAGDKWMAERYATPLPQPAVQGVNTGLIDISQKPSHQLSWSRGAAPLAGTHAAGGRAISLKVNDKWMARLHNDVIEDHLKLMGASWI